jgi:hypothetical protein
MTFKEDNRKWMDIRGAAGMVIAAGTEEQAQRRRM